MPIRLNEIPNPSPSQDAGAAWSDLLRSVRLTSGIFLKARFTAPWSVATNVEPDKLGLPLGPATRVLAFHYVTRGRLISHVGNEAPTAFREGDVVLAPHNDVHVLASAPGLRPTIAGELDIAVGPDRMLGVDFGGGGEETRLICGFIGADLAFEPVIAALPRLLKLSLPEVPGGAWMAESFAFAARHPSQAGGPADIARLCELMLGEALRRHFEDRDAGPPAWVAGAADPAVGKALALIHAEPARSWSTEALAQAVNMSRSAFAAHFSRSVGQPPMRYLTAWRMQLAAHALRDSSKSIAQVAYEIGYEAEVAFTRAFRRELGQPPSVWRRLHA
jgi:AraC-like DNA-binding protein